MKSGVFLYLILQPPNSTSYKD